MVRQYAAVVSVDDDVAVGDEYGTAHVRGQVLQAPRSTHRLDFIDEGQSVCRMLVLEVRFDDPALIVDREPKIVGPVLYETVDDVFDDRLVVDRNERLRQDLPCRAPAACRSRRP